MRPFRAIKRGLVRAAVRSSEAGLDAMGVKPPGTLLLLGHMRSGSTLLLHLLLTNPELASTGEGSATYNSEIDLGRLAIATRISRRLLFTALSYVVAQINHSKFTPNPSLFDCARVRLLFLLRQPEASIPSLLALTRDYYEPWSVERAVDYYVERLETMARYAQGLAYPERAAFLDYQDLVERPTDTLARLQSFLGMRSGFSARYSLHDFTRTRGDPGPTIGIGQIRPPRPVAAPDLPDKELARARCTYADVKKTLCRFALPSRA